MKSRPQVTWNATAGIFRVPDRIPLKLGREKKEDFVTEDGEGFLEDAKSDVSQDSGSGELQRLHGGERTQPQRSEHSAVVAQKRVIADFVLFLFLSLTFENCSRVQKLGFANFTVPSSSLSPGALMDMLKEKLCFRSKRTSSYKI